MVVPVWMVVNGVHVFAFVSFHSKPCVVIASLPAVIVPFRVAVVCVSAVATLV